jgi:hypothetical protein
MRGSSPKKKKVMKIEEIMIFMCLLPVKYIHLSSSTVNTSTKISRVN